MSFLHACLCTTGMQFPWRPGKGVELLVYDCEPPCGFWELNLDLL